MRILPQWLTTILKAAPPVTPEPTLPFVPILIWICGTCRHALSQHSPLGYCEDVQLRDAFGGQPLRDPCLCQVAPEALAAFLKSNLAARIDLVIRTEGVGGGKS